jgi:tricarballylate dehydrogenase
MSEAREFDVIVVGCGGAGLASALAAQEKGARVCILERASEAESGGNTRYTGAWLRMKSVELVSEDFESHFAENAGGYLDPGLYAVGETQGLYYGNYTGATSVLKGLVFGRLAGYDAAQCTAKGEQAPAASR